VAFFTFAAASRRKAGSKQDMRMVAKRLLCSVTQGLAFRSLFPFRAPRRIFMVALAGCAAGLGGCAQQPQFQHLAANSKEYFPSSKYGPASQRVVADGEPVPHGGGAYMVGKSYSVAGHTYYPSEKRYAAVGLASWYGDAFHGRRTANGEVYDRDGITAAHPTMPLPCYARVTNLYNHRSIIVRVNDRGPFAANRIMDVSRKTAEALDFREIGTAKVKVEYIGTASLDGSDDEKLLATLRLDGPATLDGDVPSMVADAGPQPVAVAALDPRESAAPGRQRAATAEDDEPTASIAKSVKFAGSAPLPPPRPYDLGARAPASGRLHMAARTKDAE
jgi:rare lipoprotein A